MRLLTSRSFLLCMFVAAGLAVGCSGDGDSNLTLVPVKGTLTLPGGKPVTAGMLELVPNTDDNLGAATAEIGADGSFTVRTLHKQKSRDGMAPGHYTVTYLPPQGEDQVGEPIVFGGELVVPDNGFSDANPLKLVLPPPQRN